MADLNVVAKPYAKAAYEFAKDNNTVEQWSNALESLKALVSDSSVSSLISSPACSQLQIAQTIKESLSDEKVLNFLILVAEKNKLPVLGAISDAFENFKNLDKGNEKAVVTLAFEADKELVAELKDKLAKRFSCTVDLEVEIDPTIIGGAVVRIGDTVIDSSVSGRLDKMKNILLS